MMQSIIPIVYVPDRLGLHVEGGKPMTGTLFHHDLDAGRICLFVPHNLNL